MTELEHRKIPMREHPHLRAVLDENNLSLTAHQWLPGDPIPYDQMRAILGLPDVRDEVMLARYRRFADSVSGQPYVWRVETDAQPFPFAHPDDNVLAAPGDANG
ncbi:hypothetical protein GS854_01605 [Rhodococcus hoagii]|nr:hypothetical protein [Prescottella equi]